MEQAPLITAVASMLVAIISVVGAIASSRAAGRASMTNQATVSRVDMEREAYDRARKYDTETIKRQDDELISLRDKLAKTEQKLETALAKIRDLTHQLHRVANGLPPNEGNGNGST